MDSPNENDKINEDHELQMSKHDLLLAKAEFESFLVNMEAFQDCLEKLMPKTGTVSPMETFARCISNFTINKDPQKPMIRTFLNFKECLEDISYSQQTLYRRLCSQISPQIKQVTVDSATLWRGTASSGQNVPPVSGDFAPGDAPGTFVTPLPPLSGRSASHLHGGLQALLSTLLRFQVVPHELVHTVYALSGHPDVFRKPLGFLLRRVSNLHAQWRRSSQLNMAIAGVTPVLS
ncbi:hypothetical protein T02_9817 [Trichinella nativa]|uniref:Uncharacterized protein n=1 Tax=Trichinella nativa TaxID=6335 RepID=A0A0V1KZ11_9BILA|nr:hypothetical protein T02_9817 [Trichinella nativa]